jgi:hypothetical protein
MKQRKKFAAHLRPKTQSNAKVNRAEMAASQKFPSLQFVGLSRLASKFASGRMSPFGLLATACNPAIKM